MTHIEYENICRDVAEGQEHKVLNEKDRIEGKVLLCSREYFNVQVGEGWRVWPREKCRDLE